MRYLTTADHEEWRSYVERLPESMRDVHFLPEIMDPYGDTGTGLGRLHVDEQASGEFLIWPLLLGRDGVTRNAYNFGGPVATYGYDTFKSFLPDHCECTLNPFLAEMQNILLWYQAKYEKEAVWVDLTKPDDFRQTTRHEIAKSKVRVEKSDDLTVFAAIYAGAMDRLQAAPHWRLGLPWFESLFRAMPYHTALLMAFEGNEAVAGCILLYGYGTCYYHFAASVDRPPKGTNHRMVAHAIDWARYQGLKRFHLGGGVNGNDGLFTFKAGFSGLRLPVYRYKSKGSTCCVAS